jgi:Xaa-Pro aminopeptidase
MKYPKIDPRLFVKNRQRFSKQLKPNSVAVLNSNDFMPTSADGYHPFIQQTDLFYLSGIDQEETVLVIYPDAPEKKHKEILFIKETNEPGYFRNQDGSLDLRAGWDIAAADHSI